MGLDAVDLILDVEKRLRIDLPDSVLEGLDELTIGALYQAVAFASYGAVPPGVPPTQDPLWHRFVALIVEFGGVPVERVQWNASIVRDLGL